MNNDQSNWRNILEFAILKMVNRSHQLELEFKSLFYDMDVDKNGYLSVTELINGVKQQLHLYMSEEEVQLLAIHLDKNMDKRISYPEFE